MKDISIKGQMSGVNIRNFLSAEQKGEEYIKKQIAQLRGAAG